jgi:hypothetical protein
MISNLILSAQEGDKWWLAGGIHPSQVVAAYQPKGAVDLAASYINLANPGTNDATVGIAPTLDGGWVFNGSTQYLVGPTITNGGVFVRYSVPSGRWGAILGTDYGDNSNRFFVYPVTGGAPYLSFRKSVNINYSDPTLTGVIGMNSNNGALNGVVVIDALGSITAAGACYIGAINLSGVASYFFLGNISAITFLSESAVLTSAQIAALSAAMAAL